MPENPPPNVKIYDRPQRKGPPVLIAVIALAVFLIVGYLLYKTFYHSNTPPVKPSVGLIIPNPAASRSLPEGATTTSTRKNT